MVFYLYALADGLNDVQGLTGVRNEPLVVVPMSQTLAVGGWIEQAPGLTREFLTSQDRVVRDLHARAEALLPMRFGAVMPNLDAAARAVDALGMGLRERFDLVRAREQMTVRVLGNRGAVDAEAAGRPGRAGEPEGAGTRYLKARAAQAIPSELAPLLRALKPFQRATRVDSGRNERVVGTVYQLIDRGTADAYRAAAEQAAGHLLTIRISGPSPPYAFAAS